MKYTITRKTVVQTDIISDNMIEEVMKLYSEGVIDELLCDDLGDIKYTIKNENGKILKQWVEA